MTPSMKAMDVRVLKQKLDREEIFLLDVRTPDEHRKAHIEKTTLIPLESIDEEIIKQLKTSVESLELCAICLSGRRSALAARKLLDSGFREVNILQGGIRSWEDAEFPMVRSRRGRYLARRKRFFIGTLVLGGTITSWFTCGDWWLVIPVILGLGLIFSGITGIRTYNNLLHKLHWKR